MIEVLKTKLAQKINYHLPNCCYDFGLSLGEVDFLEDVFSFDFCEFDLLGVNFLTIFVLIFISVGARLIHLRISRCLVVVHCGVLGVNFFV